MSSNEDYWLTHIKNELRKNNHLYAEFEMNNNMTYNHYPIIFKNGYKLQEIDKTTFLNIIKNLMIEEYENKKYFITTRTKDDSSIHYYIILSIIQN